MAEVAHRFPEQAEISGLPIPNHDSISDNSPKGLRAWEALEHRWARELAKINPNALIGRPEWVTLGFVKEAVESSRQLRVCHYELWPVNQLNGWQADLLLLLDSQPVGTDKARAEALARWGKLPSYLDNEIANLREGVRRGYTSPQHNVELVIEELDMLLTAPTEQTPFWSVARRDLSTLFQERWKTLVTQRIKPAIERYRSYLQEEYLKRARVPIALTANCDGAACYDASFRSYTTIRRPGTETFELGQQEAERDLVRHLAGREAARVHRYGR